MKRQWRAGAAFLVERARRSPASWSSSCRRGECLLLCVTGSCALTDESDEFFRRRQIHVLSVLLVVTGRDLIRDARQSRFGHTGTTRELIEYVDVPLGLRAPVKLGNDPLTSVHTHIDSQFRIVEELLDGVGERLGVAGRNIERCGATGHPRLYEVEGYRWKA